MYFPMASIANGKTVIKPNKLTDFEGMLITKCFMCRMAHRSECSLQFPASITLVTNQLSTWSPMWAKHRYNSSVLTIPHSYYEKELPSFHSENNLINVTFFGSKDTTIEIVRADDSMREGYNVQKLMIRPADASHSINCRNVNEFVSSILTLCAINTRV